MFDKLKTVVASWRANLSRLWRRPQARPETAGNKPSTKDRPEAQR